MVIDKVYCIRTLIVGAKIICIKNEQYIYRPIFFFFFFLGGGGRAKHIVGNKNEMNRNSMFPAENRRFI